MTLAIMQPYFMPYIGYFSLIKHTDHFIIFDTPQYMRHGWIERNRILKQNCEPIFIRIPLKKHKRETSINKLIVNNSENWKAKIFAQLVPYKKKAPNYWRVIQLLKEIFEFNSDSIVEINYNSLKKISEYLGIPTPISIWSDMDIKIENVNAPDEWALNICKALNADVYYNPTGGTSFFDRTKYEKAGIDLRFLKINPIKYTQFSNKFIPNLSIIDVLMFNSVESVTQMLNNYDLI